MMKDSVMLGTKSQDMTALRPHVFDSLDYVIHRSEKFGDPAGKNLL